MKSKLSVVYIQYIRSLIQRDIFYKGCNREGSHPKRTIPQKHGVVKVGTLVLEGGT